MNESECKRAVSEKARIRFLWASGGVSGVEGRAVAYCNEPQLLIETDSGERVWWRADLAEDAGQ